jgi:hypothetical protein
VQQPEQLVSQAQAEEAGASDSVTKVHRDQAVFIERSEGVHITTESSSGLETAATEVDVATQTKDRRPTPVASRREKTTGVRQINIQKL